MYVKFHPFHPMVRFPVTLLLALGLMTLLAFAVSFSTISLSTAKAQTDRVAEGSIRFVASTGSDESNDCALSSNPCQSIQQAIAVAAEGDDVRVAAGTYTGTMHDFLPDIGDVTAVLLLQKNLTALLGGYSEDFTSRNPDQFVTVLDAEGNDVQWIVFATGVATLIDGFKLSGLSGNDNVQRSAVRVDGGAPTFSHNQIVSNRSGYRGAGFLLTGGSAQIVSNQIISNSAVEGAGIYVLTGTVTISNNLLQSNVARAGDGGAIYMAGGTVLIANNVIAQNQAISGTTGRGGGIVARGGHLLGIRANTFYANQSADGGSAIESNVGTVVEGNLIHHNQVLVAGAALLIERTALPITVVNNLVYKNQGSGITLRDFNSIQVINNTSHENLYVSFGAPGNGIDVNASITPTLPFTATILNNLLTNNAQCGMEAYNGVTLVSDYNDLFNNKKDYCNLALSSAGSHDLNQDPRYMNASLDNYRPIPGGAVVDAGTTVLAPALDIYGDARPYANGIDMGAIEAGPAYLFLPLIARE